MLVIICNLIQPFIVFDPPETPGCIRHPSITISVTAAILPNHLLALSLQGVLFKSFLEIYSLLVSGFIFFIVFKQLSMPSVMFLIIEMVNFGTRNI